MSTLDKYKTIHTTELADRYITGIQIESDFNDPRYFVVEVMKKYPRAMRYIDGQPGVGFIACQVEKIVSEIERKQAY